MVECEFVSERYICHIKRVLIDTWWNVNDENTNVSFTLRKVLIDTWWNVNTINLQATGLRI